MTTLVTKLLALHDALAAAGLAHAFGGAIALAYCTEDPRGTRDIDINVFVDVTAAQPVLDALPPGVAVPADTAGRIADDGQIRLWWDDTPFDLFFNYAPLHAQAARGVRQVVFSDRRIPVLGAVEIVLFKALFDRPKDWVDIAAVVDNDAVDAERVRQGLVELVGAGDPRVGRWDGLQT